MYIPITAPLLATLAQWITDGMEKESTGAHTYQALPNTDTTQTLLDLNPQVARAEAPAAAAAG